MVAEFLISQIVTRSLIWDFVTKFIVFDMEKALPQLNHFGYNTPSLSALWYK
ncbi:uncharacterized protein PHALS_06157 [Plasmopara halstedii]|uniref:Uncharacterized protein n=1 Tax=Plasmopara halstedii TaxID=4781 RepID=A0A0P1B447_PLAHL|nr:uncharacterized protein PHALS_06157 [Plasmopara halstedii]CEG48330.1 hypothetical protein PHALS_06157 [Plasmopara halstedii]|eukprot:XP_024584699.1 hypothetical protein PHALS_06157 [Plasmopara halstedii]